MVTRSLLLERYRLEKRLATGGMGVVYTAMDERLGRKVAVKILKDELAQDPTFVERFRREARAAAALSHPNIANVFDYGEEGEQRFIVMELAEGIDLARLLREQGPLSAKRAALIGEQVAGALAHAHSAGLIHRDVKPANIVIGTEDRVKVTDFGIARATGSSTLTATGMVMGTANYLSPEQAQGVDLTPQSDLYSLGVVLYEMVTGSVPFTADSPLAVALRHVNDAVPLASELASDVPPELDRLISQATAKDPKGRFLDAREFQAALRPLADGRGGEVTEVSEAPEATETIALASASTSALGVEGADRTTSLSPLPITSWDSRRLGAAVLVTFGVLFALAAAFLIFRVAADEPRERPEGGRQRAGQIAPSPNVPEPAYTVDLDDLIGRPLDEVVPMLEQRGLEVGIESVEFEVIEEEFGIDDPVPGVVYFVDPPDGTTLEEGDTITLFAASDEDSEGPGNSDQGKDKGQGKDKDD